MNEFWKTIPLNELHAYYQASTKGNVRSVNRTLIYKNGKKVPRKGKLLKPKLSGGYYVVSVRRKWRTVHRLIATTFIPNPLNKPEVNHKRGIKTRNWVSDLEWSTRAENYEHAIKTGLINNKGEKNPNHRLTENQVKEIRENGNMYKDKELSAIYGVKLLQIYRIKNNKQWKYLSAMPERIIKPNQSLNHSVFASLR